MLRLRDKNPSLNCFQAEIRIQKLWKIRFGSEFRRQNNQNMWRIRFATHCKGCNMQVLCIPVMWFNDWNKWNYAPAPQHYTFIILLVHSYFLVCKLGLTNPMLLNSLLQPPNPESNYSWAGIFQMGGGGRSRSFAWSDIHKKCRYLLTVCPGSSDPT